MWVFGAGAAVLIAALAAAGWLTLRRSRARRALERSFQREWFGLARWAPLANGDDQRVEEPAPLPPVEEPWYVEGDQRPLTDLAPVAEEPEEVAQPDPAPVAASEVTALDLNAPWPPSSHEEWVAVLVDAEGAGPPIDHPAEAPPSPIAATAEASAADGPPGTLPAPLRATTETAAADGPIGPLPALAAATAEGAQAESQSTPQPTEAAESGPKYGSPEALASLASNLAPVPEYAPLAAELASFAAELAAMVKDSDTLEAGDTAQ